MKRLGRPLEVWALDVGPFGPPPRHSSVHEAARASPGVRSSNSAGLARRCSCDVHIVVSIGTVGTGPAEPAWKIVALDPHTHAVSLRRSPASLPLVGSGQ